MNQILLVSKNKRIYAKIFNAKSSYHIVISHCDFSYFHVKNKILSLYQNNLSNRKYDISNFIFTVANVKCEVDSSLNHNNIILYKNLYFLVLLCVNVYYHKYSTSKS